MLFTTSCSSLGVYYVEITFHFLKLVNELSTVQPMVVSVCCKK